MPPLPNATGCVKVQLVGTNQGALWMNQLHFQAEGGGTPMHRTGTFACLATALTLAFVHAADRPEIGFVEDYLGVARERYEGTLSFEYRGPRELLRRALRSPPSSP